MSYNASSWPTSTTLTGLRYFPCDSPLTWRYVAHTNQLEKGLGERPQLAADPAIDIPAFDNMGAQLATQWPDIQEELDAGLSITA